MADTSGEVRQRKTNSTKATGDPALEPRVIELEDSEDEQNLESIEKPKRTPKARVEDEDDYKPWVDILRVLTFLILASCGLSYLVSNGESFTWGLKHTPKYLNVDWWKSQVVRSAPLQQPALQKLPNLPAKDPERTLTRSAPNSRTDPPALRSPS